MFEDNVPVKLLLDIDKVYSNIGDEVELMIVLVVLLLCMLLSWCLGSWILEIESRTQDLGSRILDT